MGAAIQWRANPLSSALYAARAVSRGMQLVDGQLAAAMGSSAQLLASEVRATHLPEGRFWSNLQALSGSSSGRRLMVETAVIKTAGKVGRFDELVTRVVACVAGVETAFLEAMPNFSDELALRIGPLRQQWEARGAGMLMAVGDLTEQSLVVEECDVLAVQPVLGGGGEAYLAYNSVSIEAVLANPIAELPEAVRLAWLIAQLQLDLPMYSDAVHRDRLPAIAGFAMLPAVLTAAEQVELVRNTPELLARAVELWRLPVPAGVEAAGLVSEWWQTYSEARPPWRVALEALDQMFG